ncbi:flagellar filament capping protein FliD [Lysobacter korlensis]|uniref:Flagellar hook-associated protein 2 n=1 Tax=Lysobacter korlensis TaxID=553636 RepID=A0ABV6RXT4_9GAMM
MALGIDGLVSGLDTTSLINALMQAEALPQAALKKKVTSTQSLISAFQKLNTAVAKVGTVAQATGKPDALQTFKTTSSAASVTVTAGSAATPGDLQFTVGSTAAAHRIVSAPMGAWPDDPPVLTFVKGGVTTTVTAKSTSLTDVAAAVGAADAGVTVSRVAAGTDAGGNPLYRLQFTASETGAENAFSVRRGSGASAIDLEDEGATVVQQAKDAKILLWAGTAAQQEISSASNRFEGVLPGVDITVAKSETDPVTVTVARDADKAAAVVKSLVSSIAEALALIQVHSTVTTSTGSDGQSSARGGVFTGDSTVRDVAARLRTAASAPVDGRSPSEYGIVLTKTGNIEFDAEKFAKALEADPARTAAAVDAISGRLQDASKVVSDKFEGTLTSRITGQESVLRSLSTQVESWDRRLESRRAVLERTYAAMEVQLGKLNSQSTWLAGQLGSLPTSSGASS